MRKLRLAPYLLVLLTVATPAFSQSFDLGGLPALTTEQNLDGEVTYSLSLQVLALMTAVTLLPSLVLGMTSFTRIIIVLSILRQALGTQQTPPNQVLIAIALFLSLFIMQPTLTESIQRSPLSLLVREHVGRSGDFRSFRRDEGFYGGKYSKRYTADV